MTDLPARLADVLAQHDATLRGVGRPESVRNGRNHRVLLPADRQVGATPPRIGQPDSSGRSSST